ncbi:hypothetical protein GCM10020001_079720 [Nonomuraea salmonea]
MVTNAVIANPAAITTSPSANVLAGSRRPSHPDTSGWTMTMSTPFSAMARPYVPSGSLTTFVMATGSMESVWE